MGKREEGSVKKRTGKGILCGDARCSFCVGAPRRHMRRSADIYIFFFLILLVISCCAGFDMLASSAFTLTKLGDFFLRIHVLVFFT